MPELLTNSSCFSKGPNFSKLASEVIYLGFIPMVAFIPFLNCNYLSLFECSSVNQLWHPCLV